MQMIRHQNITSNKGTVGRTVFAEIDEGFMRSWLSQNSFSVVSAHGDKIERLFQMNAGEAVEGVANIVARPCFDHTSMQGHAHPQFDFRFAQGRPILDC